MHRAWHSSRRILPILLAIGLIAALAASCGDDSSSDSSDASPTIEFQTPVGSPSAAASAEGSSTTGGEAVTLEITAEPGNKFDKDSLTVPAGADVIVKFTNNDKIVHNFSVLTEKDGDSIYEGDLFKGPDVEKDEKFTAPAKPGDYYFLCDVHPDQMNGTLVVQ